MVEEENISITGTSGDEESYAVESDVDVIASHEPRPTLFDIIGKEKYEIRNNRGKLVSGVGLRWVEVNSNKFNYHEKTRNGKFIPFIKDDVAVPTAETRKPGEPWIIQNGSEKFILMERSVEENDKILARNKEMFSGKIRKSSTYEGRSDGTRSSFTFQSKRGELPSSPKFKQKRTGF